MGGGIHLSLAHFAVLIYRTIIISPFQRSSGSGQIVTHTFVLQNVGNGPLTISRLEVSSPYVHVVTNARTEKGDYIAKAIPTVIMPNNQVLLQCDLDTNHVMPGLIQQNISVYVAGETKPTLSLKMKASIQSIVSFSPPKVDFGQVSSGKNVSVTLTMTIDPQFFSFGRLWCPPFYVPIAK
jgi:hypothetical protein